MNRAEVEECMKKKPPQVNLAKGWGFFWGFLTATLFVLAGVAIALLSRLNN